MLIIPLEVGRNMAASLLKNEENRHLLPLPFRKKKKVATVDNNRKS